MKCHFTNCCIQHNRAKKFIGNSFLEFIIPFLSQTRVKKTTMTDYILHKITRQSSSEFVFNEFQWVGHVD